MSNPNELQEIMEAKAKYEKVNHNPLTPLNFLKRSELAFPHKKAVVYGDKYWSWREFAERVYRVAHGLKNLGIERFDRVALWSRNNNAMLEAMYGIGFAGAVTVPLNYRLAPSEMAYILNHSGSKAVFYERIYADAIRQVLPELESTKIFIEIDSAEKKEIESFGTQYEEFLNNASYAPMDVPDIDENDMISICYTSGTTGKPKGCVHTHRGTYLNAVGEVIEAQLNSNSSYLWTLPMFHSQGWNYVWAVSAVAGKHVCLDAVVAEEVHKLINKENVTNLCGAPTVITMLTDYMKKNYLQFPRTVRAIIGGAPPAPKTILDAEAIGLDIHQVYGLTEVYGPHTVCEWHSGEWDKLPLARRARIKAWQGVPLATYTPVRVVDADMNDIPWDGETRGEIVMQGNNVMQWYFRDHDHTEEAFRGGWFHSEDGAVIHPDGYIEIVDRIKDIIVTGGENVASVEVENVISAMPFVFDVAVVGKPDEKWGEIVKALVSIDPEEEVTEGQVKQWCRDHLTAYKIPREVEFVSEIPRTSTGKIQKNVLKQREIEAAKQRQSE
ncbi:MAG: long-chain-fatty-acid--CoA ligase [Syntrophobacteraceae bacterium]